MHNRVIYFLVLCLLPGFALGDELKPFTTDGCSAFPDGTAAHKSLWISCCIKHDLAYWKGGTYQERLNADLAMEQCVAQVGEPAIAKIMLAGVRVGGSPYLPMPYRWGYGWPYLRGYKALSNDDKKSVQDKLEYFELLIQKLFKQLKSDMVNSH